MRSPFFAGALLSGLALAGTPVPPTTATATTPNRGAPTVTTVAPTAPPDWFEVELIVIRHTQPGAGASESWPSDPGRPAVESAQEIVAVADAASGTSIAFTALPAESSRLAAQWDKFVKSSRYEPIAYFAWTQPPFDRALARSVRLASPLAPPVSAESTAAPAIAPANAPATAAGGDAPPPAADPPFAFGTAPEVPALPPLRTPLDGTATVGLARYLYLSLDLEFQPGDLPPLADGTPAPPFRLTETRRMRSKELHYFDHPLFGVLALITPRPAPPEATPTSEIHP